MSISEENRDSESRASEKQVSGSDIRIDKEFLKRKYAEERDKRLRADGNSQYIEIKGQLSHYLEDPYTPFRNASRFTTM